MTVDFNLLMIVLTIVGSVAGIVIPLHLSCRNSIDAIQKEMKDFGEKWAEESKDFHGRLVKQDAEFKAFMKEEERKRTQILMGK